MTDLLKQAVLQPRDHSTKIKLSLSTIKNACPKCGGPKRSVAKMCFTCRRASERSPIRDEVFVLEGDVCRWLPLTKGQYAIVLAIRYDFLMGFYWHIHWARNGSQRYAVAHGGNDRLVRLHRFILGVTDKKVHVDHRNGNGLDCRDRNLRACTPSQNNHNRKKNKNNTSGYVGVSWTKRTKKWSSILMVNCVTTHRKYFNRPENAAWARDLAALEHHGDFAVYNFPERINALLRATERWAHQTLG